MSRASRDQVLASIREMGATADEAEAIVAALEAAGLKPHAIPAWLNHPDRNYGIATRTARIAGREYPMQYTPLRCIQDGFVDRVIAAARAFAAASPEERFISRTFLCDLDEVRRLTHGDPTRAAQVAEVARLLLNRLRKDTIVNEALQTTFGTGEMEHLRLVDCLLDDRLSEVLDDLKSRRLDPVQLHRSGKLHFYGW